MATTFSNVRPAVDLAAIAEASPLPFRARRHHTHRTWAQTFSSLPELYIQPESEAEIANVVSLARKYRRRLVVTGSSHSPSNLTCTSSWLINLDNFNRVLSADREKGIVTMQSGIRLYQLCEELDKLGLDLPNLGSINEQSVAGVISTGTHGSSMRHGHISDSILSLKILLASGEIRRCSPNENPELFRAALMSLGALGIITEIEFQAVPAFTLRWTQVIDSDRRVLDNWSSEFWNAAEFKRVWWLPHTRRAVMWSADRTTEPQFDPPVSYYDGALGYFVYHNLLYISRFFPRTLPWIEWFVFGMQYGFRDNTSTTAVQPSRKALLMNCLYSQFVNEWAIPLEKGPEALRRLSSWLNHLDPSDPYYMEPRIPFSAKGLYVHAPLEVRVAQMAPGTEDRRPLLTPMAREGATLYLNATLYRPYLTDPPNRERYFEAFEWLMRDLGGKPHWAKNFESSGREIELLYGDELKQWRNIRSELDPEGLFSGPWHRYTVLGNTPKGELEEEEVTRKSDGRGGILVI